MKCWFSFYYSLSCSVEYVNVKDIIMSINVKCIIFEQNEDEFTVYRVFSLTFYYLNQLNIYFTKNVL